MNDELQLPEDKVAELTSAIDELKARGEIVETPPEPPAFNPELYAIDPMLTPFYNRAKWTLYQGAWVLTADTVDYFSDKRQWSGVGVHPEKDDKGRPHKRAGEAIGVADRIVQVTNGDDGWTLVSITPDGLGYAQILFRRLQKASLNVPPLLDQGDAPSETPPEGELTETDKKAQDWGSDVDATGAVEGA